MLLTNTHDVGVAFEQVLAQEQACRAIRPSLVAEIAQAYVLLGADGESQRVALQTLATQQASHDLMLRRYELGPARTGSAPFAAIQNFSTNPA